MHLQVVIPTIVCAVWTIGAVTFGSLEEYHEIRNDFADANTATFLSGVVEVVLLIQARAKLSSLFLGF